MLRHYAAHGVGGFLLHLISGVGIGAQGEACVEVSQHAADRSNVHTILQRHRCEGVPQIVQPDMFDPGAFQDFLLLIGIL